MTHKETQDRDISMQKIVSSIRVGVLVQGIQFVITQRLHRPLCLARRKETNQS